MTSCSRCGVCAIVFSVAHGERKEGGFFFFGGEDEVDDLEVIQNTNSISRVVYVDLRFKIWRWQRL